MTGLGPNGPHLRPEELVGALHDRGDGPVTGQATPGQAAPGWGVPAHGGPWTPPKSAQELPSYWRARAEGAQRGAGVRSVDYQRGAVFRCCASDLEDALAATEAEAAGLRGQLAQAQAERDEARKGLERIRELAANAKPVMWWNGTNSEAAWTLSTAIVDDLARQALEGSPRGDGGSHGRYDAEGKWHPPASHGPATSAT